MTDSRNERPQQEWYWCDTCQDRFYGSAATIHKGQRCYSPKEDEERPPANWYYRKDEGRDLSRGAQ